MTKKCIRVRNQDEMISVVKKYSKCGYHVFSSKDNSIMMMSYKNMLLIVIDEDLEMED